MDENAQQPAGDQPVADARHEQQPDAVNQYGQYAQPPQGKGKAIASLVLGILSLVLILTGAGSFIGIITSIIGLVLGSSAKKLLPPEERGMASAGFVCSLIALILSALVALVLLLLGGTMGALMMMR